jgi:hypothetical protein
MNKTEIKQIILEEIEAALEEMNMSPEMVAADSRPEEDDFAFDKMDGEMYDDMGDPMEEMARTSNVFKLSQEASLKDVLQFMQRVNDVLKTYKSPGQKRPKKRFTPEEMKALATAMLKPEGFTSKDVIAATSYSSPAQANKFLKALEMKGLITLTSVLKKSLTPDRDPDAPETRGRKAAGAEFEPTDDPMADLERLGLGGGIDLSDPLAETIKENTNTMSELEKYIKKIIKEAKSPLAKKMKEIENRGRIAALETKLAAIAEMIEETNSRLTRIDEDNEFSEMMDKKAVKEVRKQLKELERTQAKLQKERAKMGSKSKEVVDEEGGEIEEVAPALMALGTAAATGLGQSIGDKLFYDEDEPEADEDEKNEVELEESNEKFAGLKNVHSLKPTMNESTLRMQKLAGLITESELKQKLNLNEAQEIDMAKSFLENKGLKVEAVKSGNEGNDKAGEDGKAFIWDGGEGEMNYKSNGKEAFYVYMPFNEEILKEMKSKFPVIKVGGKSGVYYEVVIEKK